MVLSLSFLLIKILKNVYICFHCVLYTQRNVKSSASLCIFYAKDLERICIFHTFASKLHKGSSKTVLI